MSSFLSSLLQLFTYFTLLCSFVDLRQPPFRHSVGIPAVKVFVSEQYYVKSIQINDLDVVYTAYFLGTYAGCSVPN